MTDVSKTEADTGHAGPLFDLMRGSLDHCVKCTICETYCPVSNVTSLFPGPKYAGPQSERYRSPLEDTVDASVDYCSGCGICTQVCPQGVHIAEMNARARSKVKARDGVKLRDRVLGRPTWAGRAGTPVAPLANWTLRSRPMRIVIEKLIGIHRDAAMPSFAGRTFQGWAKKHKAPAGARKKIVYFHGCGTNYYEPDVGEKLVEILEHNGFEVEVPKGQDCCGLPLQSNGLFDDARGYVDRLVNKLAPAARDGALIVGNSTSCTLMLKREALEILQPADQEQLRFVAQRTYDICELLRDLHDRGELNTDFREVPMTVTYHAPCQQQGHGVGKPALDLMALVPGLTVIENDAVCCGVAGTYGLKVEKRQIAVDVGRRLFEQIGDAAPDMAVCDSETCRWHIEAETGVHTVHPVEVLHRAYGLSD